MSLSSFFTAASFLSRVSCGFKVFYPQVEGRTRRHRIARRSNQTVGETHVERLRNRHYFCKTLLPRTHAVQCSVNTKLRVFKSDKNIVKISTTLPTSPPVFVKIVGFDCRNLYIKILYLFDLNDNCSVNDSNKQKNVSHESSYWRNRQIKKKPNDDRILYYFKVWKNAVDKSLERSGLDHLVFSRVTHTTFIVRPVVL